MRTLIKIACITLFLSFMSTATPFVHTAYATSGGDGGDSGGDSGGDDGDSGGDDAGGGYDSVYGNDSDTEIRLKRRDYRPDELTALVKKRDDPNTDIIAEGAGRYFIIHILDLAIYDPVAAAELLSDLSTIPPHNRRRILEVVQSAQTGAVRRFQVADKHGTPDQRRNALDAYNVFRRIKALAKDLD